MTEQYKTMGTFLDKLSMTIDEDADISGLSNYELEALHKMLFEYEPFVSMVMLRRQTGQLDERRLRQSVMHMFNSGMADIQQSCYVVAISLDNMDGIECQVMTCFTTMIAKLDGK
jgi:hypothetical protein